MFLEVDDIKIIDDLIVTYAESCKTYITELKRRNDDVCEKFVQSESYLLNLKSKPSLGMKQRETILILIDIMQASQWILNTFILNWLFDEFYVIFWFYQKFQCIENILDAEIPHCFDYDARKCNLKLQETCNSHYKHSCYPSWDTECKHNDIPYKGTFLTKERCEFDNWNICPQNILRGLFIVLRFN